MLGLPRLAALLSSPLSLAKLGAAAGAEIAAVLLHAGGDLLNVRELTAQPSGIALASRALLWRSLRRGGHRHKHQREAEQDGNASDRSQTKPWTATGDIGLARLWNWFRSA
jgi:uncharacterized membrane protein YdfJ with MMPL/SSD domain